MSLHQLFDLPNTESQAAQFFCIFKNYILGFFSHLEVLLVDALPRVVKGKGDSHPPVEEDELEEEEDREDGVLELA